jgi:hypothetical protein
MFQKPLAPRRRQLRPSLDSLEGRALLNAAMPQGVHQHPVPEHVLHIATMPQGVHQVRVPAHVAHTTPHVPAHVAQTKHSSATQSRSHRPDISVTNVTVAGGYRFRNFNGPTSGTGLPAVAGTGANMNGIANSGTAVGLTIGSNGTYVNFTTNPLRSRTTKVLNIKGSTATMAFGINSAGTVVGSDGHGSAFSLSSRGALKTFIPTGGKSATAFGINDQGTIVGQYATATTSPGFIRVGGKSYVTINAPSGTNTVSAQGINNNGRVVGFYLGAGGQDHGLIVNARGVKRGARTAIAVADPTIPRVAGETGAQFMFSQILGINDKGMAVGYYGDSTGSQHGFLYDTRTGRYTFVDDPSAAFHHGVEVTQITGITNSGEITGFYSDANGVFHGFVATSRRASMTSPWQGAGMPEGPRAPADGRSRPREPKGGRQAPGLVIHPWNPHPPSPPSWATRPPMSWSRASCWISIGT